MINPESITVKPEFFSCLALLRRPTDPNALCQMLGLRKADVVDALRRLESEGLVRHNVGQDLWAAANDEARRNLGARAAQSGQKSGGSILRRGLALVEAGKSLEGGALVAQTMGKLLRAGSSAGALACLDILVETLSNWPHERCTAEENIRYLELVHTVLGVSLYMLKRRRMVGPLLDAALVAAESMGNKRISLKLRLMRVCQEYLAGGNFVLDPHEAMRRIIVEVNELGDTDILTGTVHGVALQQYAAGDFTGSMNSFKNNPPNEHCSDFKYFSGMASRIMTAAACSLGLFGSALGEVLYKLSVLEHVGGSYTRKRFKILAADVLLRTGNPDAALEMMDEAFTLADAAAESLLVTWGLRNLAWYHFQKNNLRAAHAMLRRCVAVAKRHNLHRPFFSFPYIYEMLWTFRENGFPELAGFGFARELHAALTGTDQNARGIALRILARQMQRKHGGHAAATRLLLESLECFSRSGDVLETARSQIALAAVYAAVGRNDEAEALHDEGAAVLAKYRQYDCPPISPGREEHARSRGAAQEARALANRCAKALSAKPAWTAFADHTQWLVNCLRDTLEVERVVLYEVTAAGAFSRLAAKDFTEAQAERDVPRVYGEYMRASLAEDRPSLNRLRHGACLCLPFRLSEKRRCVFFAHALYLAHNIVDRSPEDFTGVMRVLETELRLAFSAKDGMRAARTEEARRARLTAERLRHNEEAYYGPALQYLLESAEKAALTDAPILLLGETGAGKEELARRIHQQSGCAGPFVPVNPASIPESLFESELFGHEKGAFTNAFRQKLGLLELADQGTLFIDEVAEIPSSFQVKLLRVLQDGVFLRLGGTTAIHSKFRLVTATNQDLQKKVRERSFREDLYYRLAVVPLTIPPLRERPEDIRALALIFHERYTARYMRALPPLTEKELDSLCAYGWPGNVRELKSHIERGVILGGAGAFDVFQQGKPPLSPLSMPPGEIPDNGASAEAPFYLEDLPTIRELQRRYIHHVLAVTRGKIRGPDGAQKILGMKQSSLYAKIREYGLDKTSQLYGCAGSGDDA